MEGEQVRELFARQAEQIQRLADLLAPRIKELEEKEDDLPYLIKKLEPGEVEALRYFGLPRVADWPKLEYPFDVPDTLKNSTSFENQKKPNAALEHILETYKQDLGVLAIAKQGGDLDKFLDHFMGRLGPVSRVDEIPLAFVYKKEEYLIQGYRVLPKFLISMIMCIFEESPRLLQKVDERANVKDNPRKDREDVFLKDIIKLKHLRCLWADTCAYQLQLDRDTKGGRYVDKRRFDTNMNSYRAALKATISETLKKL